MSTLESIFGFIYNPIIFPTLVAYLVSVIGKIINEFITNKKLSFQVGIRDGGMPSSHTATVIGLSTAIFLHEGTTTVFWFSIIFALVVMKDATGIRWEIGQQAKAINQIMQKLRIGEEVEEDLKELLGHTEYQVFGGFIVGVIFSYITYTMLFI